MYLTGMFTAKQPPLLFHLHDFKKFDIITAETQ